MSDDRSGPQILRDTVPIPPWMAILANVIGDNGKYFKVLFALLILGSTASSVVNVAQDANWIPSLRQQTHDQVMITGKMMANHTMRADLQAARQINLDFTDCTQKAATESKDVAMAKTAHEMCSSAYFDDRERMLKAAENLRDMAIP